jgi:hypothetical protein
MFKMGFIDGLDKRIKSSQNIAFSRQHNSKMVQLSPENSTFQAKCPVFVHENWIQWILILNKMDKTNRTLLIAFNAILTFLTIFLNLLSVITIRKSSQLRNKMCYFVILVQSVVDFGAGILGIPSFILYLSTPLLRIQNCLVVVVLFQLITVTSCYQMRH